MQSTSPIWKWLWNEGGKNLPPLEYEGDIVSFDNPGYTYPKDITIGIEPVQSGSGDPSPTNVRPISGWTGANVVVSPTTSAQDGTTYPISWQSEAGTVYGGTLDVTTGLLTVTMAEVDLGTLNWRRNGQRIQFYSDSIIVNAVSDRRGKNVICSSYTGGNAYAVSGNYLICINESNPRVFVTDDRFTDGASLKAAMSGVQLVYELATPQTYQLTPTEVKLMLGENNVWADTGDMTVALVSAGYTRLEARATISGTVYTDIGVPVINRATMQDRLAVGNVVSASLSLALRSAGSVPRSAAVVIEVRMNDGQTASEWLPQGTFYISRRARDPVTGLLALECYDALLKANALWTPSAGAWPRTLAAVTAELAALLGVTLDSRTVIPTGAAYAMSEPDEGTTIRDALSIVAQAAGGNWIITPAGKLRLVRLGEAGDTVDVAGVVGGIDVGQAGTITGVRSTVDGVATLTGDDTGIVVDVALAPVIAVELAEALIGQAWQPFRLDGAVYDPAAELGDAVRAGANGEVASALCSEQAAYGPAFRGDIAAPDPGEVTDEYPYIGSAERTLALAKAAADRAVERYDDNLTQQEIFNRLTDNGAAQGLVLYNGQLYVNATYVNAGRLNVGRVNFNEPESYYNVPNENDPNSLLSGQTVADGWIVNTSGSDEITVFSCGFAIPLRGKTVTVTFAFNGTLRGGENSWYSISDDVQVMGGVQIWQMPSGTTPPNPYTYSVAVPDDAMSFSIAMECDGVKQIEVSLDSPVTPSESIVYNYEGQRIGEGYPSFQVYRDGTLITSAKSLFEDVARIGKLYLNFPLAVGNGGTGATNAASARANLEITPANIGALPISGGTMTGDIDMGQAGASSGAPSVKWRTADGTVFSFRSYGDVFQLVRKPVDANTESVLTINSNGTLYVNPQANWRSALGVVPSFVSLTAGANVSLAWQSNIALSGILIFNASVTVNTTITGNNVTVATLPRGYKAAVISNLFLAGRFGGQTHQLIIAANGTSIITGFGATNIPVGNYVLSGVILLG